MIGFGLFILGLVVGFGLAVFPCVKKLEEAESTIKKLQMVDFVKSREKKS